MQKISVEERRARLARRHFLAPGSSARDAVELAGGLVGLHATDPATVFLAARARGVEGAELERALYEERSVLRMIGMRRTLFVLPLDLAAVVQAACTESILAASRRRYAKLIEGGGIASDGEAWLDEVGAETLRALEARGEAFAAELSADVPLLREKIHFGEGKTWASSTGMTSWVLFLLAAEGLVVRGRPRGAWTSSQWCWAPAEAWLEEPLPRLEPEAARVELASRWLAAFGPASVTDLKWWTGWTLTQTRAALGAIEAVEVDLDGMPGFVLPGDLEPEPEPEPWAAFLPVARPDRDGLEGARLVPRRARCDALRPERKRRPDGVVERSRRRRLGGAEGRRGRLPSARGRGCRGHPGDRGRGGGVGCLAGGDEGDPALRYAASERARGLASRL